MQKKLYTGRLNKHASCVKSANSVEAITPNMSKQKHLMIYDVNIEGSRAEEMMQTRQYSQAYWR